MSAIAVDAPPALRAPAVAACGAVDEAVLARSVQLEAGNLRITCDDGVELVRPAAWLRHAGDGRDAIDVVLRPGRHSLTVTWRDGRRTRYAVASLRT
ncbi:MAG: hypothetical protein WEB09_00935 [Nitriliruptor sp.]